MKRGWLLLFGAAAVFVAPPAVAKPWRAVMAPGDLAKAHAAFEDQCEKCHLVYKGVPSEKCLDCHKALAAKIEKREGFHATVEKRPCLDCHTDHRGQDAPLTREAAAKSFDHAATRFPLVGPHDKLPCNKCHAKPLEKLSPACGGCHADPHQGSFGAGCDHCHADGAKARSWKAKLKTKEQHKLPMTGGHAKLDCKDCHAQGKHFEAKVACASCHEAQHGGSKAACDVCHQVSGFKPAKHDHSVCTCKFPAKHLTFDCLGCHPSWKFTETPTLCSGCHAKIQKHEPLGECSLCHSPFSWKRKDVFDHNKRSAFKLTDRHLKVDCARCHKVQGKFKGAAKTCTGCHAEQGNEAHGDFGACERCHTTAGFEKTTFDHASTGFPLTGRHDTLPCQDCHADKVKGYKKPAKTGALQRVLTPPLEAPRGLALSGARTPEILPRRRAKFVPSASSAAPLPPPASPVASRPPPASSAAPLPPPASPVAPLPPPASPVASRPRPASPAALRLLDLPLSLIGAPAATAAEHPTDTACNHCHADPHKGAVGVECARCHAPSGWKPSTFSIDAHKKTRFPLAGKHQAVACAQCHAGGQLKDLPLDCTGCHLDRHSGKLGTDCKKCHDERGFSPVPNFDHQLTGFALTGAHQAARCESCHDGPRGKALAHAKGSLTCGVCHAPGHGDIGTDCEKCHSLGVDEKGRSRTFASARGMPFPEHAKTGFPLERRHAVQPCKSCHPKGGEKPQPACVRCHVDPHSGQLTFQCEECHRPDRFRLARFDHDRAGWALRGRHFLVPCATCHTNQRWVGLTTNCFDCHARDAAKKGHPFACVAAQDCSNCHTSLWTFRVVKPGVSCL